MLRSIVKSILVVSTIGVATLGLFEIALRLVPSVLPTPILIRFNEDIRRQIAVDQGYMLEERTYVFDRDDGGPELRIPNPRLVVTYPEIFSFDKDVGVNLSVQMDEIGFCNPEGYYSQTERFDIVMIGDSLTWCHTVDTVDTFSYQLEEQTGQTVLNLGKGGVGLYEYVQILKGFGLAKRPKIVYLNVYEGNDLRDAIEYWSARNVGSSNEVDDGSALIGFRDSIRNSIVGRHSYAINTLMAALSYSYSYFAYPEERAAGQIDFGYKIQLADGEVDFNSRNLDVDEIIHARQLLNGELGLEVFTDALRAFVELSGEFGFEPVVTYIPSAHTAYSNNVVFRDPDLSFLLEEYNRLMTGYFSEAAGKLGFRFIDLTPAMQESAANSGIDELLYFPVNLHLTRFGHQVIADRLARETVD